MKRLKQDAKTLSRPEQKWDILAKINPGAKTISVMVGEDLTENELAKLLYAIAEAVEDRTDDYYQPKSFN